MNEQQKEERGWWGEMGLTSRVKQGGEEGDDLKDTQKRDS